MDCKAQIEAFGLGFGIGFKTLFLVALLAFFFGYVVPRFLNWFDRRFQKPMTVAQIEALKDRLNARFDKRIAKAKQREFSK